MSSTSIRREENHIPKKWFNVLPHLPEALPPAKDPDDTMGSRIEIMNKIRLKKLLEQDQAKETWIDIPEKVLTNYKKIGRPTPLYRAVGLEKHLNTPARIYFKREDLLPTGSFKLNSSMAQAYYAKEEGVTGLVTETGAGQWGLAIAYACNFYGLKSVVFWVKVSQEQKVVRSTFTKMLGATIYPSPSKRTAAGRKILEKDPNCPGSIGTGIGEAINFSMDFPEFKYVSGSNLPHVLLHQTVIGLETKGQLASLEEVPDQLVACVGGGSNLGGFMNPFLPDKLKRGKDLEFIAAESDAAPRLTKGKYRYDHSDPVGLTPLSLSYTLGMDYMPPPVHVGGLRQHNGSAIIGLLRHHKLLDAYAYSQEEAFKAGKLFIDCERILAAPEACHAIRAVVDLALIAKKNRKEKVIVACLSGNGLLDMHGFQSVLGV